MASSGGGEDSLDDEGPHDDPVLAELEWAIHAKQHARSRAALQTFSKIIHDDDATRDDVVFQAYVHKYELEMTFLIFPTARATATQMITRFHGSPTPYLLKANAEAKLYKLEDALLSAFVGLAYDPISTPLISCLNLTRRKLCRTITSSSARQSNKDAILEPLPPHPTTVLNVPDCFARPQPIRTVLSRFELCDGVAPDVLQRVHDVEPHATQLLVGRNIDLPPVLTQSAALAPRLVNLAQLCLSTAFLRGFYETTTEDETSLLDRDCGIILSRAVRKLESVPVGPRDVFCFDVDDTAVSSYWYMQERDFKAVPATEFFYVARYNAPVMPLLHKFYTYLLWKGIKVVFLSERPEMTREHTLAMLQAAGYNVQSSELFLRSPQDQMLSVAVLKQKMRVKLHKQQHKIIGCIGDQFCDITGDFTGSPFKIPNYMYHIE
ncbi:Aste57867_10853 [Aphanomyces stellatus]|uniref:Aste57867_10853 protein n=1 Tax=Aphanomyces stellatus TaxID=120398 RepID=A0A485KS08_9STRA|nr:hypothetical protein As57867_010813 [Aphanomyces stellatus]VFT87721.1 Aste57867_10853 [Aphanomyces stellatus]